MQFPEATLEEFLTHFLRNLDGNHGEIFEATPDMISYISLGGITNGPLGIPKKTRGENPNEII